MKKFAGTIEVAHTGKESLIYDLAKILGCDDTEEQVVDAVKRLKDEALLQDFANSIKEAADAAKWLSVLQDFVSSVYNPKFGDNRICVCGHKYYRHFDSYEDMSAVGCKYCDCRSFNEQI